MNEASGFQVNLFGWHIWTWIKETLEWLSTRSFQNAGMGQKFTVTLITGGHFQSKGELEWGSWKTAVGRDELPSVRLKFTRNDQAIQSLSSFIPMQTGARVDQLLRCQDSGKPQSLSPLICNTGTLPSHLPWGVHEPMDGKHNLPPDLLYLEFPYLLWAPGLSCVKQWVST